MTMQQQIEQKLEAHFKPTHLQVINESHMHSRGQDSHFKAVIVSNNFAGQRLLARHRQVNQVLAEELAEHIHALAIHAFTEQEWQEKQQQFPTSPTCRGGEG